MNLGHKMLIIGGIIVGTSYVPIPLSVFGLFPIDIFIEGSEESGTISLVPEEFVPFIQIFTYSGFALLVAGGTYQLWRKKR